MARLRPVVLLVVLAVGLAAMWILGVRGEPGMTASFSGRGARAPQPAAEHSAARGPTLAGPGRSPTADPVLVGAAAPARSGPGPSGAVEVLGVVIDDEGQGRHGGVVRAVRGGQLTLLGEASVVKGRFHLTLSLDAPATLILGYRDPPREGSHTTLLQVAPGERWEGVELIAVPMGALEVVVTDAMGAPAPAAVVEALTGPGLEVERLTLDAQGRARLVLPALEHVWISATSADGRYFARESFSIEPGETTRVALQLLRSWERLQVRVVSEPARLRPGERTSVIVGQRAPVEAELEGGPVFVWVPPGDAPFHVDASLGERGVGRATVGADREERERVLRDGLQVTVRLRARLQVVLVDERGNPLSGVRLWLNPWANAGESGSGLTAEDGSVELGWRIIGADLPLHTDWGALARVVVPSDGAPQRIRLPDPISRVGGVVEAGIPLAVVPHAVRLKVLGSWGHAPIERTWRPEGYRWRTSVPFPAGTPLQAMAGESWGFEVDGLCGQENLVLSVRTATLEIAPRRGKVLRPRGNLRIELLPRGSSASEVGSVVVGPRWGPCPRWTGLVPGRYEASWRSEGSMEWRVAPEPIEVLRGENRVEIDFGP